MKHFYLIILLFCNVALYGQVDAYLNEYRITRISDFDKERNLIKESRHLSELLLPFFQDSLLHVRQKAYSFLYQKGMDVNSSEKAPYIIRLLKGCEDSNGGIAGQNLIWLSSFNKEDFTVDAKEQVDNLLRRDHIPHRKRLIMLAGYVGAGREMLNRQLIQPGLSSNERWYVHLALARMGDARSAEFCAQTVQTLQLNNDLVEYVMPDLIYTRQKVLLDICIDHLNSDESACTSADPDNERSMPCGYRILELIAPVIEDFPFRTSAIGGLDVPDYRQALPVARQWFRDNPGYIILTDSY